MPRESSALPFSSPNYQPPSAEDIREALKHGEHWTGSVAATMLGVNSRTIRKWTGGECEMPYAAWRLLLILKGIVSIQDQE